jgi:hypothetical protein
LAPPQLLQVVPLAAPDGCAPAATGDGAAAASATEGDTAIEPAGGTDDAPDRDGDTAGGPNENAGASGRCLGTGVPSLPLGAASDGGDERPAGAFDGAVAGRSTFGIPLGGVGATTRCPRVFKRRPQS